MAKTAMTRRIDELGRLVIPKEIRKNLKIKDNDQIEINIIDDKIVLNKYDALKKDDTIHLLLLCLKKQINKNVIMTSREKIIDYSLLNKEKIDDLVISNQISDIIENRKEIFSNEDKIVLSNNIIVSKYLISPLIIKGDLYGSIIIYGEKSISDMERSILIYTKTFLENYLE